MHLVVERDRAIVHQRLARVMLVIDDLRDHDVLEVADDLFLGLAERGLVGDLVEIAGRFGACEFADACGGSRARAFTVTGDPLGEDLACAHRPRAALR